MIQDDDTDVDKTPADRPTNQTADQPAGKRDRFVCDDPAEFVPIPDDVVDDDEEGDEGVTVPSI
jgi:hypothetical protein